MTLTLRRELRTKFMDLIREEWVDIHTHEGQVKLSDALADAALEVSAIQKRAEIASSGGIDWSILGGEKVTQAQQDARKLEQDAVNAFESAFGLSSTWSEWWSIKPEWAQFRRWVVEQFHADSGCFGRYVAWSRTDAGKFGNSMNALQIRRDPLRFLTAWDLFRAQDKPIEKAHKVYHSEDDDESKFVPAPVRK